LHENRRKAFSFRGASLPDPHQGLSPWAPLGALPQTPVTGLRSTRSPRSAPFDTNPGSAPGLIYLIDRLISEHKHDCTWEPEFWCVTATDLNRLSHFWSFWKLRETPVTSKNSREENELLNFVDLSPVMHDRSCVYCHHIVNVMISVQVTSARDLVMTDVIVTSSQKASLR